MSLKNCYIVGDRFENFAVNEQVITLSDFLVKVESNDVTLSEFCFLFGQGINKESVAKINGAISNYNGALTVQPCDVDLIEKKYVHKHKEHNILVSKIHRLTEKSFIANMIIDGALAEMSDHMTGQHIQGMVLTEAARQMFISVAEKFFVSPEKLGSMYYVLKRTDIEFYTFVFPLPVQILCSFPDIKINPKNGKIESSVVVNFFQADELACTAKIEFAAYDGKFISNIEGEKSVSAMRKTFDNLAYTHATTEEDQSVETA